MENNNSKDIPNTEINETDIESMSSVHARKVITKPKTVPEKNEDRTEKFDVYDVLQCAFIAIVAGILIFLLVGRIVGVKGSSMYETLHDGDRLIVSKLFYEPHRGDIVILRAAAYEEPLVKRVIATEGQTIDIDFANGIVYIDGEVLHEPYIYEKTYAREDFDGPVTVPEGCVFVMGDNRNHSSDSRVATVGFIDTREIIGKAYLLLIPGMDATKTRDWSRLGSIY